jgi:broad specificity phosphatase PhoE
MCAATKGVYCWDLVVSSPLLRCAAFAAVFAKTHELPLILEEGLAEIDFGEWEGRSAQQLMQESPAALTDFWRDPLNHPPPGGESLDRFRRRVVTAWRRQCKSHPGKRLLFVVHGGVIRVLLSHLQSRPLDKMLEIEVKHAALFGLLLEEEVLKTLFTTSAEMRGWLGTDESGGWSSRDR